MQVHTARLSDLALGHAEISEPDWHCGSDVVLKIQHLQMQGLMESDIR